jgi:hypothetical protein
MPGYLGPVAGLEFFHLIDQGIGFVFYAERLALARPHGHMPGNAHFRIGALSISWYPASTSTKTVACLYGPAGSTGQ